MAPWSAEAGRCGLTVALPSARPQVILCFSPVGSILRVRARKFPAVVNCTAIDWFHEWPEDALVSVSARFLEETEGILVSPLLRLAGPGPGEAGAASGTTPKGRGKRWRTGPF